MRDQRFSAAMWLLGGLAIGALLGRQWKGALADNTLGLIVLAAVFLIPAAVLELYRKRRHVAAPPSALDTRRPTPAARAAASATEPVPPPPLEAKTAAAPAGLPRESKPLRFLELGRLRPIEFALAVPRGWSRRSWRPFNLRAYLASLDTAQAAALLLFALSLGVYALTRLIALDQFPIYFFTDEAINPVLGTELVQRGLRDAQGNLFPTYFQNGFYWNLSLSVYVHALTASLFGKSILVTRATSAILSLFGAAAVGLILKFFLKAKNWWLAVLFLTVAPAWFLHSRTAFETVMMVSFYSWFLLCYLLYRYHSPKYLFPALVFGAATFYSYANGQAVMLASGVLFLISDLPYHLRHWRTGVLGLGLLALLVLPYMCFRVEQPDALVSHLRILSSYWLQPLPLQEKVWLFVTKYAYALGPNYWFFPNEQDLARHRMRDYGNLALWTLPFFVIGVAICLRYVKSSVHRAILIAALAAPVGSALAEISITRVLTFVVPASILAALGLDALLSWVKSPRVQLALATAAFLTVSFLGLAMLRDALVNGPTWFTNYGLYGMQWGAKQLFAEAIPEYRRSHPNDPIYLTSTWANGTDVFLRFFSEDRPGVQLYNVDYFMGYKHTLEPNALLIMAPEEYARARRSDKFKDLTVERTLKYPDGTDGFFFVRLAYADDVDQVFAEEREARRQLVVEPVTLEGETVQIAHSIFDGGRVQDLVDGNPYTLARGLEANPLIVEFIFPKPRTVRSLVGIFGSMNFEWTLLLYPGDSGAPVEYRARYVNLPNDPRVEIALDRGPALVSKVRVQVLGLNMGDPVHIHVRELTLR